MVIEFHDDENSDCVQTEYPVLALIVPDTPYHHRTPILVGTKLLQQCYKEYTQRHGSANCRPVPPRLQRACQGVALLDSMVHQ